MDAILTIVILFSVTVMVHLLCLNGSDCPSNQPFCTPAGCVFKCPDSVFNNGTNCVESCGDSFIYNRTCVHQCPSTFEFIREKVSTDLLYRHRFCEKACLLSTFIHNRHCVDACPMDTIHLLNNTCVQVCPATHMFKRKIFKDSRLVAVECLKDCEGDYPVSYKTFCLPACSSPLFEYEKTCVDKCPNTTNVIFKDGVTWYCANECPRNEKSLNGTCMAHCPPNYAIYNKTCVSECPQALPFIYIDRSWWAKEEQGTKCVKQCPNYMYVRNNVCVDSCPLVLNRTCVTACPDSANLKCNPEIEKLCGGGAHHTESQIRCVNKCPNKTHEVEGNCIFACPDSLKYFNHSCLETCPVDYRYIEITSDSEKTRIKKECVAKCSDSFYRENETCVEKCPDGKYILEDEKRCLEDCSSSHLLVSVNFHNCVKQCDKNQWEADGSCLDYDPCNGYTYQGHQCKCKGGSLWVFDRCFAKASLAGQALTFFFLSAILMVVVLLCFTNLFENKIQSCTKICLRRQNENEDLLIEVDGYEIEDADVGNEDAPT